ncbi:diguanylate cyclase [Candidatus Magnetomorum sp. HK-1]|nr:diguanylate cyclase [Candidatus Magnetomorum sp. HK-1]
MKMLIATANISLMSRFRSFTKNSSFEIYEASDISLIQGVIQSNDVPQIIVVDSALPNFNADMFKQKLKSDEGLICFFILLLSTEKNSGVMYEEADGVLSVCMDQSKFNNILSVINFGRDYLALNKKLKHQIEKCQGLETENRKLKRLIIDRSRQDELTGIFNRQYIFEQGETELRRAKRYNAPLSVLLMDIDNFKRINDNFGHAMGDRVLKSLANKCSETIRESDIFGRIGGEEFAVILPESNKEAAMMASERIRKIIERMGLSTDQGVIQYTISIGAATLMPFDQSLDDLLARADKALFSAKTKGRNRSCFYET